MSEDAEETVVVEPEAATPKMISAGADARAAAAIRRAKGFGGLAGFAIAALAAHMHGEVLSSVLLRGLIGGIAGNRVAWLAAVTIWRRIIRAELHHGYETMLSRARAAQAANQAGE
ncbi:MAG TPA: hypothetical protein VGM80_11165 [Gaiellaceae bacterium]|jgi:hypothetical protein